MRSHATVSMIGSASITNPGLTPVDSTATFARFAIASIFLASDALRLHGIAQLLGGRDDRHFQL